MDISPANLNKRLVSQKDIEKMATDTAYKTIVNVFYSIRYELKEAMQLTPQIEKILNEMETSYLKHAPDDIKKESSPAPPKEINGQKKY